MTGKQSVREILDQLCEEAVAEYDWRQKHIDQALDSIEEVVKEVLGEEEEVTYAGGIPFGKELWRNEHRTEQLGRWEGNNGQ